MLNREDRRQRVLAKEYERFAKIQTGGAYQQCHARRNMQDPRGPLLDFALPSGLPVANSYDNKRTGTKITLMRKSTGWVLIGVERVPVYKEGGGAGKLTLTRRQYDEAAKRLMAGIEVLETETT